MPTVPTYDGPQVRTQALRPVYQDTPDVSSGLVAAGRALNNVGEAIDQRMLRDAETEAWKAQAKMNEDFNRWNSEELKNAQGDKSKGYSDKVATWWDKTKATYSTSLSPYAQRIIGKSMATVRGASFEAALKHEDQQLEVGRRSAFDASVASLQNQAISVGPDKAAPIITQMRESLRQEAQRRGIDPAQIELKATTGVHTTFINRLMQRDPKQAELYFNTNKKEIEPTQWDELEGKINQVSAITDGENKATEIWNANVKQGDYKNPVDQFALEKAAREAFPNDPTRQKNTIAALRERTAAWNASQTEINVSNTNSVWDLIDGRRPMTEVMKSQAWMNLPASEQHRIRLQLETEASAREGRRLQAAQRGLVEQQIEDRKLLMSNADKYLDYSDPQKLATMTRDQVKALRSDFGLETTKFLLDRYDTLQKTDLTEARLDDDSFKRIANDFGFNSYVPKTKTEKEQLGDLKYRTERVLAIAQSKKGAKLSESEKEEVMRQEMAKKVKVESGWWFVPDSEKPVIQLSAKEVQKVVVPANEVKSARTALAEMRKLYPNDARYQETPENIRSMYLRSQSRSANFIPQNGK